MHGSILSKYIGRPLFRSLQVNNTRKENEFLQQIIARLLPLRSLADTLAAAAAGIVVGLDLLR